MPADIQPNAEWPTGLKSASFSPLLLCATPIYFITELPNAVNALGNLRSANLRFARCTL